jgi:hypothetical protein
MNKEGGEKDTDARRRRRCIDDRRRGIISSFSVAIMPIITAVVVIPSPSVIVTAAVMFSHTFMVTFVFGEGRSHVYTADHCG